MKNSKQKYYENTENISLRYISNIMPQVLDSPDVHPAGIMSAPIAYLPNDAIKVCTTANSVTSPVSTPSIDMAPLVIYDPFHIPPPRSATPIKIPPANGFSTFHTNSKHHADFFKNCQSYSIKCE